MADANILLWYFGQPDYDVSGFLAGISDREQAGWAALRFPQRKRDWLNGRWVAHRLLGALTPIPDNQVQVTAGNHREPVISYRNGETFPGRVSLAHSGGYVFGALAAWPGASLGVDVEQVQTRDLSSFKRFFQAIDWAWILSGRTGQDRQTRLCQAWALREAWIKANLARLKPTHFPLLTEQLTFPLIEGQFSRLTTLDHQGKSCQSWVAAKGRFCLAIWDQAGDVLDLREMNF